MPYATRSDLPDSVKDNLPVHAQDIYKEAFNSAWDEYGHEEERAHRVAWGAVKEKYHKNASGKWVQGKSDDAPRGWSVAGERALGGRQPRNTFG